jgi:hypothetical protein
LAALNPCDPVLDSSHWLDDGRLYVPSLNPRRASEITSYNTLVQVDLERVIVPFDVGSSKRGAGRKRVWLRVRH